MNLCFEPADSSDLNSVYEIIKKRVNWMEEKGLKQWNCTDYLRVYPLSYFSEHQKNERLFVLRDIDTDIVMAVMVLLELDERWPGYENRNSFFVHNFATLPNVAGLGGIMLKYAEKYAISSGKSYLRLDCPSDNEFLNNYYEERGYIPAGECIDRLYRGNRKEKKLL